MAFNPIDGIPSMRVTPPQSSAAGPQLASCLCRSRTAAVPRAAAKVHNAFVFHFRSYVAVLDICRTWVAHRRMDQGSIPRRDGGAINA